MLGVLSCPEQTLILSKTELTELTGGTELTEFWPGQQETELRIGNNFELLREAAGNTSQSSVAVLCTTLQLVFQDIKCNANV